MISRLLAHVWPLLMFWDLPELFHLFCDDILWGLFFVLGQREGKGVSVAWLKAFCLGSTVSSKC